MIPAPTKSEELAALRAFVDGLPDDSYLADIFRDVARTIDDMIRDDLAWPIGHTIAALHRDRLAQREQIDHLTAQVTALAEERRRAERARDIARAELEELRGCARKVLQIN